MRQAPAYLQAQVQTRMGLCRKQPQQCILKTNERQQGRFDSPRGSPRGPIALCYKHNKNDPRLSKSNDF
jgi:hypothetical protein